MRPKCMTGLQLYRACQKHDYLLLTLPTLQRQAMNCKIAKIAHKKGRVHKYSRTNFIGYTPCDFHTYYNTPQK